MFDQSIFNRYFGEDVPTRIQEAQLAYYWEQVEARPPENLTPDTVAAVREWYRHAMQLLETLSLADPDSARQIAIQQVIDEAEDLTANHPQ